MSKLNFKPKNGIIKLGKLFFLSLK